jgi:hypothetical protein
VDTNLSPRDVVTANGIKYITAEHGDGFYLEPIYKHFKLFEVDSIVNWYPAKVNVNPVTGLENVYRDELEEEVYLSTQPKSSIEDSIHIPHKTLVAVCNAAVKVDDRVGDYVVTKSDAVLGVTLLEMKKI